MEKENNFLERLKNSKKIPIAITIIIVTSTSVFFIIENNKNRTIQPINNLEKFKNILILSQEIINFILKPK